jgi:Bax protein
MANFKIVVRTLMAVIVVAFFATTFYYYTEQGKARAEANIPKLPNFEHTNNQQFLDNVVQCVNYIEHNTTDVYPVNLELLLAQAALESGWGNSRFARVGKNLFGIRTYDLQEPHMLPSNNPKKWGVKVYSHECDSVLNYMQILNNGGAYKKYRELRENGIDDPYILVETLDAYAADKHYFSKIKSILTKIRSEYEVR